MALINAPPPSARSRCRHDRHPDHAGPVLPAAGLLGVDCAGRGGSAVSTIAIAIACGLFAYGVARAAYDGLPLWYCALLVGAFLMVALR